MPREHRRIGDIAAQTEQVLRNLRTALAAADAGPEHVVKWNVVVVDGQDFGSGYAAFQRAWGDRPSPPVITAAVVKSLAHPDFLVGWTRSRSFLPDRRRRGAPPEPVSRLRPSGLAKRFSGS